MPHGPVHRRGRPRPLLLAVLLCATAASTAVAPIAVAQPGSGTIVYVQDDQIWIATPDGSQRHQVTTEGRWFGPSMADDGTIIAATDGAEPDEGLLVRMTQGGEVLSAFVPDVQFDLGLTGTEVQPSGELVAYGTIGGDLGSVERATYVVDAAGEPPTSVAGVGLEAAYGWYPGTDVLVTSEYDTIRYLLPGRDASEEWIDRYNLVPNDIDVSRDGALMAIAGCDFGSSGDTCEQIELHELSGPPPAATVPVSCRITHPDGHVYDAVALSPGGGGVAYAIRPPDSVVAQVVVHPDADVRSCDLDAPVVLGDTTTTLDWSPAPFDPAGGGGPPAPGGGPAPDAPVISLADGGRVDGGGAEDPVGQTIATSRSAWGDGEAELVVLATADRFPDALAGAALAGERGPILVTPFAEQLDARVAAEIARVTGGDGIALVLGGTSAVSEGAAAAAGEAAGATSCPAPYPTDCRYAGTGREDTAARIASTVLDRDGDLGVVLLARGDAFADAITGGAYAAEAGIPILLTPSTQLDAGTEAVIRDRGIEEVIILGGTAAVSDAVADALPATVRRVAGADRTETSAAIATELWQSEGLAGGGVLLVNVRDERGWPAALAAAGVSALANAPQLGVEDPPAPPGRAVLDAADALSGPVATYASTALVSDAQLAAVEAAR